MTDADGPPDYESAIDEAIQRLEDMGIAPPAEREGCTNAEIRELEHEQDVTLPGAYRTYLGRMGKACGTFLRGSDRRYPRLRSLTDGLQSLMAESDADHHLSADAFAFLGHQSYQYLYFETTAGENPPVYHYLENDPEPERVADSFTEWLLGAVDDEIGLAAK